MKALRRIAVVGAAIASTLVGATAAHASGCSTKVGTYMTIAHCGTIIDITYNKGTSLGHSEIWEYSTPSVHFNGIDRAWVVGGFEQIVNWPNVRTCVEFWLPNGSGGWTRLNNEIDCSPA